MKYYDKTQGDCLQGDIILFPLPDDFSVSEDALQIISNSGSIKLLKGEATGHFHRIVMGVPTMFRNDRTSVGVITGDMVTTIETAKLYQDQGLTQKLISAGELTTDSLCIGYLVITCNPVELKHDEHDSITIPPGVYYVGRQREWTAGEARAVQD